MFSKHRLEALSDGIFAIAMTLLILDLKVPTGVAPGQLWHALAQESHTWVSFFITFVIAARYWVLQHRLFSLLEAAQPRTVGTTFVFLGLITILPFTTALWGHYLTDPLALFLYFLNQAAVGIVLIAELELARREHNLRLAGDATILRGRLYIMTISILAAMTAAWFLPIQYIALTTAAVAVVARRLRTRFERRAAATVMAKRDASNDV